MTALTVLVVVLAVVVLAAAPTQAAAAAGDRVASGSGHTCAILPDSAVACWGLNDRGQLGLGDTADRGDGPGEMGDDLSTVDLGTDRSAQAIAAGDHHTCAILDDNTTKCWGANANGQLGLGDSANRGDGAGEMGEALPTIDLGRGRTAKTIAAGLHHTCAILDNNTTKCWGNNDTGQLGL